MDKVVASAKEAIADLKDGDIVALAGFGLGHRFPNTLIRELREELGIDVTAACLAPFAFASHEYEKFHLLMPLYLCRRWKGTPTGRENQTLAWVRPQKLTEYEMPPADKPLIPLLRDFL